MGLSWRGKKDNRKTKKGEDICTQSQYKEMTRAKTKLNLREKRLERMALSVCIIELKRPDRLQPRT